jgi:hypothetical protein
MTQFTSWQSAWEERLTFRNDLSFVDDNNDGYLWEGGFVVSLFVCQLTAVINIKFTAVKLPATKREKPVQYYLCFFSVLLLILLNAIKQYFSDFQ